MSAFNQALFVLFLGINALLPFSVAAPQLPRSVVKPHVLNLRGDLPSALEGWQLYNDYHDYCETHDDMHREIPETVSQGTVNIQEKLLTYNCDESQLKWSDQLAQTIYATLFKGTLSGESLQSEEVVLKRSRGQGPLMLYGASLQQQFQNCENILPVIDSVWVDSGRQAGYLILPFIADGALSSKLDSYVTSGQHAVNKAFKQILNGVRTLHESVVMHRDLKPANVLVDGETLKIADFDSAIRGEESNEYAVGTDGYIAPEVVRMSTYGLKVDTFALGMTWMVMSIPDLAANNNAKLLLLWKSLVSERDGNEYLEASQVEDTLNSFDFLKGDSKLRALIANTLCGPDERLTVLDFYTQFTAIIDG